ncbi:hypothetical protein PspKH34_20590 [Parageobacillus sp. KH3-4]|jgi:hypothetical protein|uniref:Uncharacterized protein n=1 Tax=Parageobacillus thermoglucosidasius TaxID=1426 RepID=A0A1B7KVA8_PARTM|nr:hypothetical protein A7K69_16495 [Parageobacillus thermoglucosidasius]BDG47498.1 hypothetical protein PspKH34_20590 [Parageobacillus sp. KH3-4]
MLATSKGGDKNVEFCWKEYLITVNFRENRKKLLKIIEKYYLHCRKKSILMNYKKKSVVKTQNLLCNDEEKIYGL